ncbi:MAG: hypothetical protein CMN55_15310 [Sneathiella sp.]|jgi:hypothetical protein|uniref:hypothetical protein n=1 Tax=Sneathiella sp. TaxID=1964365 RepID=UPI000C64DEAF|nr:hypothetical protein [Sneathiella sp.]MAL80449.1 hypothetical protein [Sneathiella sp.]|tara:strand:- start:2651 stop:2938 length:288 start_codon:yes stop_codon:yes gene_type:complete
MNTLFYLIVWAVIIFVMMCFGDGVHVLEHGRGKAKQAPVLGVARKGIGSWVRRLRAKALTQAAPLSVASVSRPSIVLPVARRISSGQLGQRREKA